MGGANGLLPAGSAPLGLAGLSAPLPGTAISASFIGGAAGAAAAAAMLAAADNAAAAAANNYAPAGAVPAAATLAAGAAGATPALPLTSAFAASAFGAPSGAAPALSSGSAELDAGGLGAVRRSVDADLDARFCQAVRLFGRDLKVRCELRCCRLQCGGLLVAPKQPGKGLEHSALTLPTIP